MLLRKRHGPESFQATLALAYLGTNLLQQHKYTEAEPVLRQCLAVRAREAPDSWATFNTRSQLGGALLGQKKYPEAEPLLLQGYEGLKQREARIPANGRPRLIEALERLVQLYEATARPDQAAAWRKRLDEARAAQAGPGH